MGRASFKAHFLGDFNANVLGKISQNIEIKNNKNNINNTKYTILPVKSCIVQITIIKEFNVVDKERSVEPHEATLYFFYADWCPHYTRAKQPGGGWYDFKQRHGEEIRRGNTVITINEVDCTDDKEEGVKSKINEYKVKGYPTIILNKNGEHYLYDTKPDADHIDEFLDKMI